MSDPSDTLTTTTTEEDPTMIDTGNHHRLLDVIQPDHPAESVVRVIAHSGEMEFVEITSMTGSAEDWSLQLNWNQAQDLADALQHALAKMTPIDGTEE